MLLSSEDVLRLERRGYCSDSFVRYDSNGYAFLRNRQGCCAFYNVSEKKCNVYAFRPSGCRVYPIIYDEDVGIVFDSICCSSETITVQEKIRKGKIVVKLLAKIDKEAVDRRSK
jgi:Fe-S-cluster containining protein